jgi:hypothetical protein
MPIIRYEGDVSHPEKIERYNGFVKKMLGFKKTSTVSALRPGLSIPPYYLGRKVTGLFDLYKNEKKEPDFVVMDFGGMRLTDQHLIASVPRVIQHFKNEGKEKYYLYGLNVKPHKSGEDTSRAEDLYLVTCGFNSFGDWYRAPIRRSFPPPQWRQFRTFRQKDYRYHRIAENNDRTTLEAWMENTYGAGAASEYRDVEGQPKPKVSVAVRRYNFHSLNSEMAALSDGVAKSDNTFLKQRLADKDIPQEILTRFGKNQK